MCTDEFVPVICTDIYLSEVCILFLGDQRFGRQLSEVSILIDVSLNFA